MTVADVIVLMIIIVFVGLVIILKRSSSGSLDKTIDGNAHKAEGEEKDSEKNRTLKRDTHGHRRQER